MTDLVDPWQWYIEQGYVQPLAEALAKPLDHDLLTHSFGCAMPSRGGACDCGVIPQPSRGFDYGLMVARLAEGYYDEGES